MKLRAPVKGKVLRAIQNLTLELGFPPSIREIGDRIGEASEGNVHRMLAAMRDEGLVTWHNGRQRTIRVVREGPSRAQIEGWSDQELYRIGREIEDVLASRNARAAA